MHHHWCWHRLAISVQLLRQWQFLLGSDHLLKFQSKEIRPIILHEEHHFAGKFKMSLIIFLVILFGKSGLEGCGEHIPRQEFRLGYSPKHSESLHWLEYRENTKCYDPRPFTSKLGFWAYLNNVGLGHKLPRNPTASWRSSQVLQYTHIYRHYSSPN